MESTFRLKKGGLAVASATLALVTLGGSMVGVSASGASAMTEKAGLAYAQAQVAKYSGKVALPTVSPVKHIADLKGKTVWYIPITNAVDSLAGMGTTMTAALKKVGAKVQICDGGGLPTTVATCLTSAAQQGAAAVVTSFIDYEMAPTGFQALAAAGIPVIVGSEPPDPGVKATKDLQFTYGTAGDNLFGELMAFETIVQSKGKANVLVLRLTDSASTTGTGNIEISYIKKYCPGCTVTSIDIQTAALAQVPSNVAAALTANPNINYITVPVDPYLPPVTGALATAGLTSKVHVISADGGVAGLEDVAAGSLLADPGGPIEFIGWEYADAVIRILSGDAVPATPAGPNLIFTKKNLTGKSLNENQYLTMNWYGIGEAAFEAPFLKAWSVK
jgi:ribose transport system substrate-binding protein